MFACSLKILTITLCVNNFSIIVTKQPGDNINAIESLFFLQFYKNILGVKKSTPNCILYGELSYRKKYCKK